MADSVIHTRTVSVQSTDLTLDAYLAEPDGNGPFPGVVVLQEIFGVNAHIRDVTERLARLGYAAIAPALYQRTAPGFEVGYSEAGTAVGRQYKTMTQASELLRDIQASIDYLKEESKVKATGLGCIGFCFGGHVAYLAATLPDIQATASFYGAGVATTTPGGGPPTMTLTPRIQGTIYLFFGSQDPLIPKEETAEIAAALRKHQIRHQIYHYPAGHGFFCDQRGDYRPEAAADAWIRVQAMFSSIL